jgi:hypothetical protein
MNDEGDQPFLSSEVRILWENVINKHNSSWNQIESNITTKIKETEFQKLDNQIKEFRPLKIFSNTYYTHWGMGNLDAKLVFIFYCPTYYEFKNRTIKSDTHMDLELYLKEVDFDPKDIYFMYVFPWTVSNKSDLVKECEDFFLPYVCRRLEIIRPKVAIGVGFKMKYLIDSHLKSKYYEPDSKNIKISNYSQLVKNISIKNTSFSIFYINHPYNLKNSSDPKLSERMKELFVLFDKICNPNKILGTIFLKNGIQKLDPTKEMVKSSKIFFTKKKESPFEKSLKKSTNKFKKSKIESE